MGDNEVKLLDKLKLTPESVGFQEVMSVIADNYYYNPSAFTNGQGESLINNVAGSNEGSCKIFAFAQLHQLSVEQTLHCFGDYYRVDVIENPQGSDHGNIRAFMESGWEGVHFEKQPLKARREA